MLQVQYLHISTASVPCPSSSSCCPPFLPSSLPAPNPTGYPAMLSTHTLLYHHITQLFQKAGNHRHLLCHLPGRSTRSTQHTPQQDLWVLKSNTPFPLPRAKTHSHARTPHASIQPSMPQPTQTKATVTMRGRNQLQPCAGRLQARVHCRQYAHTSRCELQVGYTPKVHTGVAPWATYSQGPIQSTNTTTTTITTTYNASEHAAVSQAAQSSRSHIQPYRRMCSKHIQAGPHHQARVLSVQSVCGLLFTRYVVGRLQLHKLRHDQLQGEHDVGSNNLKHVETPEGMCCTSLETRCTTPAGWPGRGC